MLRISKKYKKKLKTRKLKNTELEQKCCTLKIYKII